MRFQTFWWGVQILSETVEEVGVLEEMLVELPGKRDGFYDDGQINIIRGGDPYEEELGYDPAELGEGMVVLEILR